MDQNSSEFDVFQWANAVDEVKNNVSVELFLFNKNYTPYKVRYSDALMQTIKSLFMLEAVEYINKEADKGLECREYELSDGEDKVIYRIELSEDLTQLDVDMTMTAPSCPMADFIVEDVRQKLESIEGLATVNVNLVFEPEWSQDMMTEEAKLELGML